MTAVTLSTLTSQSLAGARAPTADRCQAVYWSPATAAGADRVLKVILQTPGAVIPAVGNATRASAERCDATEHRARGLLNLVAMLTRCLETGGGSWSERREWQREVDEANARLGDLYRAALSRTLTGDPETPAASGGDRPVPVPERAAG